MNIQISVIVPIYNVQRFLANCLKSILCQKDVDFEVICVNDGSTDDSLAYAAGAIQSIRPRPVRRAVLFKLPFPFPRCLFTYP